MTQSVIFHIFQLFESLATNVAIEKVLVFIFAVISFVNQQIVLFAESSVTIFAIVSFNHCSNFFPTPNMGRWVWMYNEHGFLKPFFFSADYEEGPWAGQFCEGLGLISWGGLVGLSVLFFSLLSLSHVLAI